MTLICYSTSWWLARKPKQSKTFMRSLRVD